MSSITPHVVTAYRDESGTWKARCRCGAWWDGERTRALTMAACRQACHVMQVRSLTRMVELECAEYARNSDVYARLSAITNLATLAELDPHAPDLDRLMSLVSGARELARIATIERLGGAA